MTTTDTGTDITLNDRRKEFINKNLSLCESNCEYKGYNLEIEKVECECEVKIKIFSISEISINKDKLYKSFTDINNNTNLNVMKCYRLLFNKEMFKDNIGFYIFSSIILVTIISCVIFNFKGSEYFKGEINKIFSFYINNKIEEDSIIKINCNSNNDINKKQIRNNTNKKSNEEDGSMKKSYVEKKTRKPIKIKQRKKIKKINLKISENIEASISSKNVFKNKRIKNPKHSLKTDIFIILKNNLNLNTDNNIINNNQQNKLNDYELNTLDYQPALKIDKRTYIEYYFSLLREKHALIFTFYTNNDYNSKIIKFILFLFSFSLYLNVNALFFSDSTMHKIYQENGKFNFIYQIPQILYSTLISSTINIIITTLSLSQRNILDLKKVSKKTDIQNNIINTLKKLKIKFIIFFVILFPILFLFWYYISCFCAVYRNTQIHLIKDTLISFCLSLVYPFFLKLLPGIFRIPSLKAKKQDKECLFKFSKILQIV